MTFYTFSYVSTYFVRRLNQKVPSFFGQIKIIQFISLTTFLTLLNIPKVMKKDRKTLQIFIQRKMKIMPQVNNTSKNIHTFVTLTQMFGQTDGWTCIPEYSHHK